MASLPNSALGIDWGRSSAKAVLMVRRGSRFVASNFAVAAVGDGAQTPAALAAVLRALVADVGGNPKACGVAVSDPEMLVRIIEQPETPPKLLRDALKLNGGVLLNQDVKDYVLDCDLVPSPRGEAAPAPGASRHYLVAGLPKAKVEAVDEVFKGAKRPLNAIQLAPISALNAFEFAKPELFHNEPFLLVDVGQTSSTVTVGFKGSLILVRSIDYGGDQFAEALSAFSGADKAAAMQGLDSGDEMLIEGARMSLAMLTREVSGSIGFFEARREETISHVMVSGGICRSQAVLNVLSEELHMPCEAWHPFESCEISVPADRRDLFAREAANLSVACGMAVELIKPS